MRTDEAIRVLGETTLLTPLGQASYLAIQALEKQIPKKVYHFLEDDTFETTCCKSDVTNQDYVYCPNCGNLLGEVEEVEE